MATLLRSCERGKSDRRNIRYADKTKVYIVRLHLMHVLGGCRRHGSSVHGGRPGRPGRRGRCRTGHAAATAVVAVVPAVVGPQQILTLHLPFEAGDVTVAKVFAQLLDLFQLQQVYPKDLNGLYHLKKLWQR